MFQTLSRSWSLVKASAAVLRADRELMWLPVLSALCAAIVITTFAVPTFALRLFDGGFHWSKALLGFLFYFCQYAVIVFFNSALVAAALICLQGGDPTLRDGLSAAWARLPAILGYAAIAATIGVVLQGLKNRDNNIIVRFIASGLGVAWTLATFLVVPVLVAQGVGPLDALKRSVELLRRTWGENAVGQAGIGAAFGLLTFVVILAGVGLAALAAQASTALAIAVGVLGVATVLLLAIVQAALSGIYSAALYRYAVDGRAPAGFESTALVGAFAPR